MCPNVTRSFPSSATLTCGRINHLLGYRSGQSKHPEESYSFRRFSRTTKNCPSGHTMDALLWQANGPTRASAACFSCRATCEPLASTARGYSHYAPKIPARCRPRRCCNNSGGQVGVAPFLIGRKIPFATLVSVWWSIAPLWTGPHWGMRINQNRSPANRPVRRR